MHEACPFSRVARTKETAVDIVSRDREREEDPLTLQEKLEPGRGTKSRGTYPQNQRDLRIRGCGAPRGPG